MPALNVTLSHQLSIFVFKFSEACFIIISKVLMSLSILLHLDLGLWLLNLHLLDLVLRGSLNLIAMAEPLQMMNRILQCGLQIVQNQVLAMVLQARICLHHSLVVLSLVLH